MRRAAPNAHQRRRMKDSSSSRQDEASEKAKGRLTVPQKLERQHAELAARVAALEQQQRFLQRSELLLQKAVQIREHQMKLLALYGGGVPAGANLQHVLGRRPKRVPTCTVTDVERPSGGSSLATTLCSPRGQLLRAVSDANTACSTATIPPLLEADLPAAHPSLYAPTHTTSMASGSSSATFARASLVADSSAAVEVETAVAQDTWYTARVYEDSERATTSSTSTQQGRAEGSSFDLKDLPHLGRAQVQAIFLRNAIEYGNLLMLAEKPSLPGSAEAMAKLEHAARMMRTIGSSFMTCNPLVPDLLGTPLEPGLPPEAEPQHWDRLVAAMKLSPLQLEDFQHLNTLRLQWMARAEQEELSSVAGALSLVMQDLQANTWKTEVPEADVRKAELMAQVSKAASTKRMIVVLVSELVKSLITPIQAARYVVHSYPYIPSACHMVEAAARLPMPPASRGAAPTSSLTH